MPKLVSAALAAIHPEGTFAVELTCPANDLRIDVERVGRLRFPITASTARKLCRQAQPAPYGVRARTLYDRRVRDGWEILPSKLRIVESAWRRTLEPVLATVRGALGFPEDGELRAEFDKLLVYGPGQFFAKHKDSERSADMVGTLIVELPSEHEGGSVVVEHGSNALSFLEAPRGAAELGLVAFYADCLHEVKPVRAGHRVVLTFRLCHTAKRRWKAKPKPKTAVEPADIDRLVERIGAHFETPRERSYTRTPDERPDRLVYLLDHEYTQRSLHWDRLKNADRLRVDALLQAAERLDCEAYLALADVHENWSCEEDGHWGPRGYRSADHDLDAPERQPDDYELFDLVDSDVELRHWVGLAGRPLPDAVAKPPADEICETHLSVDVKPYKSEHEGYMGNYGNTVDRWYHRAAFVMWPRSRSFALRARASASWAVKELAARVAAGGVDDARARARELLPAWPGTVGQKPTVPLVRALLRLATALDDAALALALLAPLEPHLVGPSATPAFVAAVAHYGVAWGQQTFEAWTGKRGRWDSQSWLAALPRLAAGLGDGGERGAALALWLVDREAASLAERYRATPGRPAATDHTHDDFADEFLALLEGANAVAAISARHARAVRDDHDASVRAVRGVRAVREDHDASVRAVREDHDASVRAVRAVRDELVAIVTSPPHAMPALRACALLETARAKRKPAEVRALGLGPLHRHAMASLQRSLAAPPRRPDDWSIEPPQHDGCALCGELAKFLVASRRTEFRWPLAKERRRHVHGVIDAHRLPVAHATLHIGSPQTLVLEKQPALFEQATALRARQKALLSWLKREKAAFADVPTATTTTTPVRSRPPRKPTKASGTRARPPAKATARPAPRRRR